MADRDEFDTADLRRQWQAGARRDPAHLDDAMWERLACEELTPFERERALAHVTACEECGSIYRGLAEMRREAAAFDPAVAAIKMPAAAGAEPRPWWYSPWLAGSLATAAIVVWAVTIGPMRPATDYSGDVARTNKSAVTLLSPKEGAGFDRVVAWQAVSGATSYRIVGFTQEGTRAFEVRDVRETTLTLAPDVVLAPGRYFLQVTALRDGEAIAESPLVPFTVRF